jgi:hypothetical protein
MKQRIILIVLGVLLLCVGFFTLVQIQSVHNFSQINKQEKQQAKLATGSASIGTTANYWRSLSSIDEFFATIPSSGSGRTVNRKLTPTKKVSSQSADSIQ